MTDTSAPPPRPHLLVVDDDDELRATLQDILMQGGFDVSTAADGTGMRAVLAQRTPALVLLDLRLKGEDGLTLARSLRSQSSAPLVMMSGQSEESDRVRLLEDAADDFLIKPFAPRELVARVRAILRRVHGVVAEGRSGPAGPRERLRFGAWELDLQSRELFDANGTACPLTQGEYRLLETFVQSPGRVWTRDQLLERTRGADTDVFDRAVDVLILRLRRKIEPNPKHPQFIVTERGQGYVFGAAVAPAEG